MEPFISGVLVGLAAGAIGRPLVAAWLWTRERSRVSRAAGTHRGDDRPFRAEILPESRNGAPHPARVGKAGSTTPRRPRGA